MTTTPETCPEEVWDRWDVYVCGRPVKRNGLCGIHAHAAERRAAGKAARDQQRTEDEVRLAVVWAFLHAHNLDGAYPETHPTTGRPTGRAVVTLDALRTLLTNTPDA